MNKKTYIAPLTEICTINAGAPLLEIVDFNSPTPVDGGIINANSDELWEEEPEEMIKPSNLWDN